MKKQLAAGILALLTIGGGYIRTCRRGNQQ